MTRERKKRVQLAWVIWDGREAHVDEFRRYRDSERPTAHCPECHGELTLKLGDEVAWHAAHRKDADCAITDSEGESALHFNVKMHIARQLRSAERLCVMEQCAAGGASGCLGSRTRDFESGWDEVVVEHAVGTRRPDIALLRRGATVAAIEVWAKHKVGRRKKQDLAALDLPWVELKADLGLLDDDAGWNANSPLPIVASGPAPPWTCATCSERTRAADPSLVKQSPPSPVPRSREAIVALDKTRRRAFQAAAKDRIPALAHNGVVIRRLFLFDRFTRSGAVHRDGLVIADVHRVDEHLGAFSGFLGDLSVVAKMRSDEGPGGYLRLRDEGMNALAERAPVHDLHPDPVVVPRLLESRKFTDGWYWEGVDHRWPREGALAPSSPWVVDWGEPGVDYLDLMRFLFARYWSGLPVRYRWSRKNNSWFLPRVQAELKWRLWV